MLETMHAANGIGLAAQQVGEALQLTVIDVSGAEDRPSTMKLNGAEVDPESSMPLMLLNPRTDAGRGNRSRHRRVSEFSRNHGGHQTRDFRGRASADARRRDGGNRSGGIARARAAARGRSPERDSVYRPDELPRQGQPCEPAEANAKGKRAWLKTLACASLGKARLAVAA